MEGGGQDARHRRDAAVEGQLAEHEEAVDLLARQHIERHQQADRDRQVVVAAFLRQVGRREIDGDALRRQREADGGQRRAHPLAAFANRLVRQADDGEGRHPAR